MNWWINQEMTDTFPLLCNKGRQQYWYLWWLALKLPVCTKQLFTNNTILKKITAWQENHPRNQCNDNFRHVNITHPVVVQLFVNLTGHLCLHLTNMIFFKISFVPDLETKLLGPKLTTRNSEHCWQSLFPHWKVACNNTSSSWSSHQSKLNHNKEMLLK